MEKFLTLDNSIVGIVIMMALHLFLNVGKFVWSFVKKKSDDSEAALKNNTAAIVSLIDSNKKLTEQISELPKLQKDIKRYYTAIKILSGEKWSDIRKEITEEESLGG